MLGAAALLAMTTISLTSCGSGGGNDAISSMKKVNDKMDQMIKEVEKLAEETEKSYENLHKKDNLELTSEQEDSIEKRYKLYRDQLSILDNKLERLKDAQKSFEDL